MHVIKSAVGAALSVQSERAKKLTEELNSQCLHMFKDQFLGMNSITDSDGYGDCDNEDESAFWEKCLTLADGLSLNWKEEWSCGSWRAY